MLIGSFQCIPYLPQSVQTFAERDDFVKMLLAADCFTRVFHTKFWDSAIYTAKNQLNFKMTIFQREKASVSAF